MAFQTHLVAIAWQNGHYRVASECNGPVDYRQLEASHRIADVTQGTSGYMDEAAILSRQEFAGYIPHGHPSASVTESWYRSLPDDVFFILVHNAEWESGLGDS